MRSYLVVISPPSGNGLTGLLQRLKPVLVEALIPEGAVKALDVSVLALAARLDQDVFDAMLLCPGHERTAGELRPVVSSDRLGVATKGSCPVQQPGHIVATHAEVCGDVYAFTREVIGYRQAFDAP